MGFFVLGIVTVAALSLLYFNLRLGIGPVPTSRAVRDVMLQLCPPETTGTAYELGSGWGGLARALARRCPNATVIGVEASFVPWAFSALVQKLRPVQNLRFVRANFHALPLEQASLLLCYLFTGGMRALAEKSFAPGAVLISAVFSWHGKTAETVAKAADLYGSAVYRYRL